MDPISLALAAINGLRLVLANPALGGGSRVRLDQASEILGTLGSLLAQGDDALDDLREFTRVIEELAETGRTPSIEEWDILKARSEDAASRVDAALEELLEEEQEEEETSEPPASTETETVEPGETGGAPV